MTILIITHKYQTASFFSLLVLTPSACYNRIMILSVSRRTDVPAFYGEWFLNRLKEGVVCVRNPMNSRQISRVELTPGRIEAIVFWTKNPAESFLEKLNTIEERGYRFYFQFTLTPYGADIEPGLPLKKEICGRFRRLARQIGRDKVVWRYDPILFNDTWTPDEHRRRFAAYAETLAGSSDTCVISFLDVYPAIRKRLTAAGIRDPSPEQIKETASALAETAAVFGLRMETCAETVDLESAGIAHGRCIDPQRIARLTGRPFSFRKDKGQRPACGCAESLDIGTYGTCPHGCLYCYARRNDGPRTACDVHSPLLCSVIRPGDTVTDCRRR